jgi:hypothetical protein
MAISLADHHDHRTQLESQSEATFRTVLFDSFKGLYHTETFYQTSEERCSFVRNLECLIKSYSKA